MIYQLFKVRVYKLEIENKNELVAHGTLMDSFFKDNFYLKINLNNPDDIRAIGLYIKYEDNYVFIKLSGACAHCGFQDETINFGIEAYLKDQVPEIEGVINVDI